MSLLHKLSPLQARDLAQLIELEACWENLRIYPPKAPEQTVSLKELQQKQKAYEAFHVKLTAYNKGYRPAHVPELLLNTPDRLSAWCQSVIALHAAVQDEAPASCPTHLLEKAYRWANRLSDKMNAAPIARPSSSHTISALIGELQDLSLWCDGLSATKRAG
jgi:hypothetical protein